MASIVVHQALAKSLDRFNTAMGAQPVHLQQQQQQRGASPGGRQQPGAAYAVQDSPSELTYDELAVSHSDCRTTTHIEGERERRGRGGCHCSSIINLQV